MAAQLLITLEALLPDICQVCNEEYTVERGVASSLSCKGGRQGFHKACYDRLEIGDSLAELPGSFSWLCAVCAPHYTLTTVIGGRKGQERPRLSRRGTVTTQPIQVPLADTDAVPATESDASDQVETAPSI